MESHWYQEATCIFAFMPLQSEVDILAVLRDAYAHKHLALPVTQAEGTLTFHPVHTLSSLVRGRYNILEPAQTQIAEPDARTLIIVPAMAYTPNHERLGRGKGYYDRYLSQHRQSSTIGVCRTHQLLDHLPSASWDIPVMRVLCNGIFY